MIDHAALTRRAALAAVLLMAAGPALASSPKKKEGKEGEGEKAPEEPIVKIQPFAVPIVENGRLINYVFVTLSLKMAPEVPVTVMEGQEPILRDAIVRAAHKTGFMKADSYNEVDAAKLKAAVLREAASLVGKGKVASAEIVKQIPRKQLPPPSRRPSTTKAPTPTPIINP